MANLDKLREIAKSAEQHPHDLALTLAMLDQVEHFLGLIERIAAVLEEQARG